MAVQQMKSSYPDSPLAALVELGAENTIQNLPYGGDIAPEAAYEFMLNHPAVVIDVRTLPEWQFVGLPDLHETQAKLVTISWKNYPDFTDNTRFFDQLADTGLADKDTPLLFICRSGGRSLDAAIAAQAQGYHYCFNIADGFEGDPNADSKRGVSAGWKAKKLPWKQG